FFVFSVGKWQCCACKPESRTVNCRECFGVSQVVVARLDEGATTERHPWRLRRSHFLPTGRPLHVNTVPLPLSLSPSRRCGLVAPGEGLADPRSDRKEAGRRGRTPGVVGSPGTRGKGRSGSDEARADVPCCGSGSLLLDSTDARGSAVLGQRSPARWA